jgi:hypothetical protein
MILLGANRMKHVLLTSVLALCVAASSAALAADCPYPGNSFCEAIQEYEQIYKMHEARMKADEARRSETEAREEARDKAAAEARRKAYEARQKEYEARQKESATRTDRCIAGLDKLRIGMTEAEVNPIIDCTLFKVNTDQTVNHVRKQVVLYISPPKAIGYLYLDNAILTAIQRR